MCRHIGELFLTYFYAKNALNYIGRSLIPLDCICNLFQNLFKEEYLNYLISVKSLRNEMEFSFICYLE